MADETEVPRLIEDPSIGRWDPGGAPGTEPEIALVFAQLGMSRTREGLAVLLNRRLVAWSALDRFLAKGPSDLTAETVCQRTVARLQAALGGYPEG